MTAAPHPAANPQTASASPQDSADRDAFPRELRRRLLPSKKDGILGSLATLLASYLIYRMEFPKTHDAALESTAKSLKETAALLESKCNELDAKIGTISNKLQGLENAKDEFKNSLNSFSMAMQQIEFRTRSNEREIDRLQSRKP